MRKTLFSSLLMAAAAMTAVSCSSDVEEFSDNKNNGKEITFVAGNPTFPETRSYINIDGEKLTPMWRVGDYLTIFCNNNAGNVSVRTEGAKSNALTSKFKISDGTAVANSNKFVAIHLGDASRNINYDYRSGVFSNLLIENRQSVSYTEFSTDNDILVSKTYVPGADFGRQPFALEFLRVNAVMRLNIIDETGRLNGSKLSSLTISAPEEEEANNGLFGTFSFNSKTCEITKENAKKNYQSDNADRFYIGDNTYSTYIHCIPTTLHKGNTLKFKIITLYGNVVEKTITLPTDVLFESSKITTLNVTVKSEDFGKTSF